MGVYKKGQRWYADFYVDGKRRREVVKLKGVIPNKITRQDALSFLHIKQAEVARGEYVARKENPLPFEQLASMYLDWARENHMPYTCEREEICIAALKAYFGGSDALKIDLWKTEKYKSKRRTEGKAPSTINKELAVLRLMFNVACKGQLKRKINKNPVTGMKLLKIPNKRIRVLKDWEFQKLYEACSGRLKPIVLCAYVTGMRRSEIANLKWENIDFQTKYIHLEETKTNEPRSIPINELLMEEMNQLKEKSKSEYVFTRPDGEPYTSRTSWRTSWERAVKASGVDKIRFHGLRHTFTSNLIVEEKEDFATVMSLTGHKDIRMLKHYSHTHEEAKKAAVNKLSERIKAATVDTSTDTHSVTPIGSTSREKKKK